MNTEEMFTIVGEDNIPSWWEITSTPDGIEKRFPVLFKTEEEAQKYHLDNWLEVVTQQVQDFHQGLRGYEDIDFMPDDYVIPCWIEDGVIYDEMETELFNPKNK